MKVTVLGKCGLGKDESARERVNFKWNPRSYFLFRFQNASFSYIFARCTGQNFTWLLKTQCVMNTLRRRLDFHWKFFGERKELNCILLLVSLHTGQLRHCTRGAGPQETRLWESNESLIQNTIISRIHFKHVKVSPPNSFIHTADFQSPGALAQVSEHTL